MLVVSCGAVVVASKVVVLLISRVDVRLSVVEDTIVVSDKDSVVLEAVITFVTDEDRKIRFFMASGKSVIIPKIIRKKALKIHIFFLIVIEEYEIYSFYCILSFSRMQIVSK